MTTPIIHPPIQTVISVPSTAFRLRGTACLLALLATPFMGIASVPTAADVGAQVPFVTHEAESAENNLSGSGASIVRMALPSLRTSTPEQEASGRAYAELTQTGDTLSIPVNAAANSIVIRHSIPDAPEGGGIDATLTLLVNGQERQQIPLSSRHNWLYGNAQQNGQSNTPGTGAHVFWDEARAFISGPALQPEDTLQLRKGTGNTAAFYRIDLIDLEYVQPPMAAPSAGTYVSVMDYGATGDGVTDDTAALEAAVAAAQSSNKKIVWLPAGTYVQTRKITVNGQLRIQGAGMWHTSVIGTEQGTTWGGTFGFNLTGNGPSLADLHFDSVAHTSRTTGGKPVTGNATNWTVERIWITHSNTGLWMSGAKNGIVRHNRVRFTYADAINLNRGASNNLVEHNHVRGCGDDGIASLSETERSDPPSVNNTIRRNTVTCIWWGLNIDLAGGSGHIIEENYLADNSRSGLFGINMTGAYPNYPVSDSVFRRNVLVRGGGDYVGQKRGAIWSYGGNTTITNITISENRIVEPMFRAINLVGTQNQQLEIVDNLIEGPYKDAFHVGANVSGEALLKDNTIAPPAGTPFVNPVTNLSPNFTVQQTGNSW